MLSSIPKKVPSKAFQQIKKKPTQSLFRHRLAPSQKLSLFSTHQQNSYPKINNNNFLNQANKRPHNFKIQLIHKPISTLRHPSLINPKCLEIVNKKRYFCTSKEVGETNQTNNNNPTGAPTSPEGGEPKKSVFEGFTFSGGSKKGSIGSKKVPKWLRSKLQEKFTPPEEWKDVDPKNPLAPKVTDILYQKVTEKQLTVSSDIPYIQPEALKQLLDEQKGKDQKNFLLIDLRNLNYIQGEPTLPSSVSWPIPRITGDMPEIGVTNNFFENEIKKSDAAWERKFNFVRPTQDSSIVFYSSIGKRSEYAVKAAQEAGFKNVKSLWGGSRLYNKLFTPAIGSFPEKNVIKFQLTEEQIQELKEEGKY